MKHFDKLVRDGIPGYLKAKGLTPHTCIVHDAELIQYLKQKLVEEAQEVAESDQPLEELGDVYEVINALLKQLDLDWTDVYAAAEKKRQERGGFEDGIVLDHVEDG